jgi:hypothetical protein
MAETITVDKPSISDETFERSLSAAKAAAAEYSDAWWEDFDRELRENGVLEQVQAPGAGGGELEAGCP